MNVILYKGERIAKGSDAAELHEKKEFAKLDEHLRALDQKRIKLSAASVNYKIGEHPEDWK